MYIVADGKLDAPLEPQRIMGEMCWAVMLRVVECECVSVCVRVLLPRYMPHYFFFVAVRAVGVDCLS